MARYTWGALAFKYGSGSTISWDYVGHPAGYRTAYSYHKLTVTAPIKVNTVTYAGDGRNVGAFASSYVCRINQSSSDQTAAGVTGTVTFPSTGSSGSVRLNFGGAVLTPGTYYVWLYTTGGDYTYFGSGTTEFTYSASSIEDAVPEAWIKTTSGWKQGTEIWIKTTSGWKQGTEIWMKTTSGWEQA